MPKPTFYDQQVDRLDGLRRLLATWEICDPVNPYLVHLEQRIINLSGRVTGKRLKRELASRNQ